MGFKKLRWFNRFTSWYIGSKKYIIMNKEEYNLSLLTNCSVYIDEIWQNDDDKVLYILINKESIEKFNEIKI